MDRADQDSYSTTDEGFDYEDDELDKDLYTKTAGSSDYSDNDEDGGSED